ncbi:hypothetical protein H072_8884 [Dactylellina haptotyla CBS 200.50]|uniref:Uncharacterized protein n=1 Tax=Dactylellina haptotyla (strain CBS 200.50) TaxID=1284197 RepID=S8A336_DACHA|nr:hypothetical protein H072_8884 [Dactylellina haptotyla CBS 200.50]
MRWRGGISSLTTVWLLGITCLELTAAVELLERQSTSSGPFSGEFCDYTSFQASVVGSRLLMFGGNLTVNKGTNSKEKRQLEPGFQFFSMLLNQTISATSNVSSYLTREPDPSAQKKIASMRDGGSYSYNGDIFFYGGEQLFNAGDDGTIYKCTPTSENIVWNQASISGGGVNRAITKGASVDASTENKGFYFGGQNTIPKGADSSQADLVLNDTFVNNLVVVTFSGDKQEFTNISAPVDKVNPLAQSNLLFVPAGKEGILVNLGGIDSTGSGAWDTLQVFDIGSSTWFNQQTRGNLTSGRSRNPGSGTCSVIVSNGDTHYIYVYGGSNRAPGQSQLAILTIPTFQWATVENSNFPSKVNAQCQISGQRQMLILGGRSSNSRNDCGQNNFLEILDLSSLTIVSNFPDNSPFTVPAILVTLASNGTGPADGWTDPDLEKLYEVQYQTLAQRNKGSKSDKGAIIGGVVGGVAGVILIGIVAVYFIMKNHRKKSAQVVKEVVAEVNRNSAATQPFLGQPSPGFPSPGLPSPGYPSGYGQPQEHYKDEYAEAPANQIPAELPPQTPSSRPMELPT